MSLVREFAPSQFCSGVTMQSHRWIRVDSPGGGTFEAYLSLPPAGRGPGIVLVQEIFGVNAHIRGVADQYAMDGFVVIAPDIFWRQSPRVELGYDDLSVAQGRTLKAGLDFSSAVADLSATATALSRRPELEGKVAVLGYCMGGLLAYLLATHGGVDAAVCYYGAGIDSRLEQSSGIKCPMLFHFGEKDDLIPASAIRSVSKAFAHQADAWVQTYPGVDHGFNCWSRSAYDQQAAALARGRTLEFLSIYL